jgi:dihydrofolate reductase
MKLAMIAAMAADRVIGKNNKMPWHLPADLAHFKRTTMAKPVIMGRKTYESIGKALPGRLNIVITGNPEYQLNDASVVASPAAAIALIEALPDTPDEAMIIGGGKIYQQFLPKADRLYLTFIESKFDGDTQFPDYQAVSDWQEVEREQHCADEKNKHNYTFVTLDRV